MHEHDITQRLLDQALQEGQKAEAQEIACVHIHLGEISSFSEQSIRFYWSTLSAGTMAEGADLVFHREAGCYFCRDCEHTFPSWCLEATCPRCGSMALEAISGQKTYLEALDIVPRDEYASVL
ncbi:MAG: hydrogenase maturation nickel metallochaperone HypA [Anaerolineales bacterium]|nr:hydrogenase maturation nickel metallochaperone HypA [Anaerolineales bacterium]